jgi:putative zinc finger protein
LDITTWLVVMTREFPDELLSAFLDGELSPQEHEQVERHLAVSAADRQLVAKLQSLRSEVQSLPPVAVSADFADRVVRSAIAEAEKHNASAAVTSLPAASDRGQRRRIWIGAAVASAAALAASVLLVVQFAIKNKAGPSPGIAVDPAQGGAQIVGATDALLKSLYAAVPVEGESVVLRLRVAKDAPLADALNSALEKAGLTSMAANMPTGAAGIAAVYGKSLETKYGPSAPGAENKTLLEGTVAAAQALFIEAPLEKLEAVVRNVSDNLKHPVELDAATKLAFTRAKIDLPEGEPGSASKAMRALAAGQPFAQQLDAAAFRLEKKLAQASNAATQTPATVAQNPKQIVRVLLLVEAQ